MGPYDAEEESEAGDESAPDSASGKVSAAQALIRGIKLDDAQAVSDALSSHYKLCEAGESDDEEAKEKPPLSLAVLMAGRKKK